MRRVLLALSSVQLAAGVAGQLIALRDGRAYDLAFVGLRGMPEKVGRDSWLIGTGLSAPVVMMAVQAFATARLAAGPSRIATRTLAIQGMVISCGYLAEREFREAVSLAGRDRVITPVVATGFATALGMVVFGAEHPISRRSVA